MKNEILIKRDFLVISSEIDKKRTPFFASKLLNQFGVIVDKPLCLSKENVETVAKFFGVNIPDSFYSNPQDLKFFTCSQLLLEQAVSYFSIENFTGVFSEDKSSFDRIELFKKVLPKYKNGNEVVFRNYKMLSLKEADKQLISIAENLSNYTRKWSETESDEFKWLYLNGYYNNQIIQCKDNIIELLIEYKNAFFAAMLNKKDVVKLSIMIKGERKKLIFNNNEKTLLGVATRHATDYPLSKKQAKYFNTISKKVQGKSAKESNCASPYKIAKSLLNQNEVIKASEVLANNGSLLERNLVWLLSRANTAECEQIVDMIKVKNPIVLAQLLLGIVADDYTSGRVFNFYNNRRRKTHIETDYEHKYRKSILSLETKSLLIDIIEKKIKHAYSNLSNLGDIYVSEEFKNVALPINTSACGSGINVLPTGSRLNINGKYIRAFCYWHNAFDIDTTALFYKNTKECQTLFWGNYNTKEFGDSALHSGDNRSNEGSEYIDLKLDELKKKGYKYIIYAISGYNSTFEAGEIYCGYQNKDDLDTKAWSEKNISLKMSVQGNSREYLAFAIDLETNEIVVLNQILDSQSQVADSENINIVKKYLSPLFLKTLNMYKLLSYRGNIIDDKEKAKIVFDSNYVGREDQQVIKAYEIEKLINILK